MEELGNYILSVTAAAVIVSITCSFFGEKSAAGILSRMVGGLFLTFVMLSPVARWDFDGVTAFAQSYEVLGEKASRQGQDLAADQRREIIMQRTSAYILDKAGDHQTQLTVNVILSEGTLPVPEAVYLEGQISPYAKQKLQRLIETELGIPKERQIWTG